MIHLNDHLLCAIDTETTGLDPHWHELIEIAIIPLDQHLKPNAKYTLFNALLAPNYPERIDPKAMRINKIKTADLIVNGVSRELAFAAFEQWVDNLQLKTNKKLTPLAHNWTFDREFIISWMGVETFHHYFYFQHRDTMPAALFCNDKADINLQKIPYPKLNLQYLASSLNAKTEKSHRAVEDALTTAEVYRRMLRA